MANPYTTTFLLNSVKRRGMIPSTAGTLTSSDFYELMNEELQGYCVEALLDVHEEFFVGTYDYSITSGQASYLIPPRAVDAALRDVLISDGGGGFRSLPRCEPTNVEDYGTTGGVQAYYLEGNSVVLIPAPTVSTGTLRLKYPIRPNRLVTTAEAGEIATITTATKVVTVTAGGINFPTASTSYDFIQGTPHFGSRAIDQAATRVGTTLTFASALPTGLAVGDFICLAGESCIPQVPLGMHQILAHRTVAAIFEALGNTPAQQLAEATAEKKKRAFLKKIQPRVPGSSRIIVNRYGPGWTGKWRHY